MPDQTTSDSLASQIGQLDSLRVGLGASFSDTISLSDALGQLVAFLTDQSDSISLTDAQNALVNFLSSQGDSFSFLDVSGQLAQFLGSFADSISLVDLGTLAALGLLSFADALALAERLGLGPGEKLSDGVSFSDGASATVTILDYYFPYVLLHRGLRGTL